MQDSILKALEWRYAVKVFDSSKKITAEELNTILESGRLAPSSIGIEPWKFIVVENPELRAKIRVASYDQPKITDASHVIIIARRTDARANIAPELLDRTAKAHGKDLAELAGLNEMVSGAVSRMNDDALDTWVKTQSYIPLGMMIETAALLGVDSCPMEGFNGPEIDNILALKAKNLMTTTVLTLGHRGVDPAADRPKVRRDFNDAVEFIT